MKPTDVWAQRLQAFALLVASISLLTGTIAFAWTEVASIPASPAKAAVKTTAR